MLSQCADQLDGILLGILKRESVVLIATDANCQNIQFGLEVLCFITMDTESKGDFGAAFGFRFP